jgi:hypothetical protein
MSDGVVDIVELQLRKSCYLTARCVRCGTYRKDADTTACYPGDEFESYGVHGWCPPPPTTHGPFTDEEPQ